MTIIDLLTFCCLSICILVLKNVYVNCYDGEQPLTISRWRKKFKPQRSKGVLYVFDLQAWNKQQNSKQVEVKKYIFNHFNVLLRLRSWSLKSESFKCLKWDAWDHHTSNPLIHPPDFCEFSFKKSNRLLWKDFRWTKLIKHIPTNRNTRSSKLFYICSMTLKVECFRIPSS